MIEEKGGFLKHIGSIETEDEYVLDLLREDGFLLLKVENRKRYNYSEEGWTATVSYDIFLKENDDR